MSEKTHRDARFAKSKLQYLACVQTLGVQSLQLKGDNISFQDRTLSPIQKPMFSCTFVHDTGYCLYRLIRHCMLVKSVAEVRYRL